MSLMAVRSVRCKTMNPRQSNVKRKDTQLIMIQPKKSLIIRPLNPNAKQTELEGDSSRLIFSREEELVEIVVMAKRIADVVATKRLPPTDPHFCCAINFLNTLKDYPLTPECLKSTKVINCLECLTKHPELQIRTKAAIVLESWKTKSEKLTGGCNFREKIRAGLLEAFYKVVAETSDEITKAKVERCNQIEIADAVELAMYKKMGDSNMAKYRSILFNLKDPKNTELRRRVLLGEIRPCNLVEMKAEEMASSNRKRENEEIRVKASFGKKRRP